MVHDAKGGSVYRDHLPLLGQHSSEIKPGAAGYQVGDQVTLMQSTACPCGVLCVVDNTVLFCVMNPVPWISIQIYNMVNISAQL